MTRYVLASALWFVGSLDARWLQILNVCSSFNGKQKLCELTDVTEKEKIFFLLWNRYMQANPILSQIQLPSQTFAFVSAHCSIVLKRRLEEQLIAHLTNMWYEGVIGQECMLKCMDFYNKFAGSAEENHSQRHLHEARYWNGQVSEDRWTL